MAFYKLESTYKTVIINHDHSRKREGKTLKWFCNSYESMSLRLRSELYRGSRVAVKEISEAEYIKGIEK